MNNKRLNVFKKRMGGDVQLEAEKVNPEKNYISDPEIEVTDEQKLEYLRINEGQNIFSRYNKPLVSGNDEIVMSSSLRFGVRRTLLQELKNTTEGQLLFDVPFSIASTEY